MSDGTQHALGGAWHPVSGPHTDMTQQMRLTSDSTAACETLLAVEGLRRWFETKNAEIGTSTSEKSPSSPPEGA